MQGARVLFSPLAPCNRERIRGMFDKTKAKLTAIVSEPARNVASMAVFAFVMAILALLVAVTR
jgi:hypothetical protein